MAKIIIPCPVAENGTKTAITENQDPSIANRVSFDKGIPDICAAAKANGGQPPRLEDFNYLFYLLSNELFELQRGIQYTFQSGIAYNTGAVLWYPTGKYFVRSLVDGNTEVDLTNPTYWEQITVNSSNLTDKANINLSNIINTGYAATRALNAAGIRTVTSSGSTTSTASVDGTDTTINVNYRIWSDGWCQLDGELPPGTSSNPETSITITLPIIYDSSIFRTSRTVTNYNAYTDLIINNLSPWSISTHNGLYGYDAWFAEGQALGWPVLQEIVASNSDGDPVTQLGSDVSVTAGETYFLQGKGSEDGGFFSCKHTFTQSGTLKAWLIRGKKAGNGHYAGNGVMITLDGDPILVAGGGGYVYSGGSQAIGGSGYNGGSSSTSNPGYSYNGTDGDSTDESGAAGKKQTVTSYTAYGGSGYVRSDFSSGTTTYNAIDANYDKEAYYKQGGSLNLYGRVSIIRAFEWI